MAETLTLSRYGRALLSPTLSQAPLFEDIHELLRAVKNIGKDDLEESLSSGKGPTPFQHLVFLDSLKKKLNGHTAPKLTEAETLLNDAYKAIKGPEAPINFIDKKTRHLLKDIKPQFADLYIFLFRAEFARTGRPFARNIYSLANIMACHIREGERKRSPKAIQECLYKAFSKTKNSGLAVDVLHLIRRTIESTSQKNAFPSQYALDIFYPLYNRFKKELHPDDKSLGWWLTCQPFGTRGEYLVETTKELAQRIREEHPEIKKGLSDDRLDRGCIPPSHFKFRPFGSRLIDMIGDFIKERLEQIEGIEDPKIHLVDFYDRADKVLRTHNPQSPRYKRPDAIRGAEKTALYKIFCINKYGEKEPLFKDEEDFISQFNSFLETQERSLINDVAIRLAFRKPENLFGLNKRYIPLLTLFISDISKSPEQLRILKNHFREAVNNPSSSPEDVDISKETEVRALTPGQMERRWRKTCLEILKNAGIKPAPLALIKHEGALVAPHMKGTQPPQTKKSKGLFLSTMVSLGIERRQAAKLLAPNTWNALNVAVGSRFKQHALKQLGLSYS